MRFRRVDRRVIQVSVLTASLVALCLARADDRQAEESRLAGEVRKEEPCLRVGEIFIVGNTITRDTVILRQVPFRKGDEIRLTHLRTAQRNLAHLGVFKDDPPPEVRVIEREGDEESRDIMINVDEKEYNAYFWAVQESLEFAIVWMQSGLLTAIHRSEEGTFPIELLRFALCPKRENVPFAIDYFLNRLR